VNVVLDPPPPSLAEQATARLGGQPDHGALIAALLARDGEAATRIATQGEAGPHEPD